ncbi:MAG: hypothetical protein JSV26_09705 [bacterium]|nr:MAG: hypothetical protein JSV26_09705 [bacterium]
MISNLRGAVSVPPDPVSALRGKISRLRLHYTFRRLLDILAVSIAADILLDLLAFVTYLLFRWSFHVPFFLEFLIIVLMIREYPRLRRGRFVTYLDRRFRLQDRLYSFFWYQSAPEVADEIRAAQAEECLRSVDFLHLKRFLRVRVPPLLLPSLPVFLVLVFLYMNAEYRPPGTLTRTTIRILDPTARFTTGSRSSLTEDADRQGGGTTEEGNDGDRTASPEQKDNAERADSGLPPDPSGDAEQEAGVPGDEEATGRTGGSGHEPGDQVDGQDAAEAPADGTLENEPIQSNPVSESLNEPVPPKLLAEPSLDASLFDQPEHLFGLLPWMTDQLAPKSERYVPDIPGYDPSRYPARYREHLQKFHEELQTWARKTE